MATYEGEHNHGVVDPPTIFSDDKEATNVNDDVGLTGWLQKEKRHKEDVSNTRIEQFVGSLIKDPNFTVSLAEAVARSITTQQRKQQVQQELDLNLSLTEV